MSMKIKKNVLLGIGILLLGVTIRGEVVDAATSSGPVWYHYVQGVTVYSQYYHPKLVHSSATGWRGWDGKDHVGHRSGLVEAKKVSYSSYKNYNGFARAWYNSYE